jgi:Methyltransferase domain
MAEMGQTFLDIVNHIMIQHPELAAPIEEMAIRAQGRSLEDLTNFREWKFGEGAELETIFSRIYAEGQWGQSGLAERPFYSGSGSHDDTIVATYVAAISEFASKLGGPPSAVDLGCGDFNVGSRIRPHFARYTACDVVPDLIKANRKIHAGLDVDFLHLDLTRDEIPAADVILIRQVLQHLSNRDIARFVASVAGRCRYLVVTEHLPGHEDFAVNIDKPAGPNNRTSIGSGVVLTAAPFNLAVVEARQLCSVPEVGGQIVTVAYTMP